MAVTPHRPCDEHGIVSMSGQPAIRRVHGKVFHALMWSVIVVLESPRLQRWMVQAPKLGADQNIAVVGALDRQAHLPGAHFPTSSSAA
jgi:hypothetical protein